MPHGRPIKLGKFVLVFSTEKSSFIHVKIIQLIYQTWILDFIPGNNFLKILFLLVVFLGRRYSSLLVFKQFKQNKKIKLFVLTDSPDLSSSKEFKFYF